MSSILVGARQLEAECLAAAAASLRLLKILPLRRSMRSSEVLAAGLFFPEPLLHFLGEALLMEAPIEAYSLL